MTKAQIDNTEYFMEQLFEIEEDLPEASGNKHYTASLSYYPFKDTCSFVRGNQDHKKMKYRTVPKEDVLPLPDLAELLRSYGFRLGYPSKSLLYDPVEGKILRGTIPYQVTPFGLSNRDKPIEFSKNIPYYPMICHIHIHPKVTRTRKFSAVGTLTCWIGMVRKVLREERERRLHGITYPFRSSSVRLPYRLATPNYDYNKS